MSQELVRPVIVNQLQELPDFTTNVQAEQAEVITLHPYLKDTGRINAEMNREFSYLERRENWRRWQFLRAVSSLGYPAEEVMLETVDSSFEASEGAWDNIANYRFSDGSSLPEATFTLKEFEKIDSQDQEAACDGLFIATETTEDVDAWIHDDKAEEEFKKFIEAFNKRPIASLGYLVSAGEAQGSSVAATDGSSQDPIEIVLQTEIDFLPSSEVLQQIKASFGDSNTRLNARSRTFSYLIKLIGL